MEYIENEFTDALIEHFENVENICHVHNLLIDLIQFYEYKKMTIETLPDYRRSGFDDIRYVEYTAFLVELKKLLELCPKKF